MKKAHSQIIAELKIDQIESYLKKTGWRLDGQLRTVATIWHREENFEAEVLLPFSDGIKDYLPRMQDAIRAIANYEKRELGDIFNDILNMFSSVIAVRVIGSDTAGGTIPINDGVLLIENAKDMLMSAAMAMFSKRRIFSGKPPKNAASYIESLLLGQTEVGSYVVNVLVPQENSPSQSALEGAEPVEGVALSLAHSLEALLVAGEKYDKSGKITEFDAAVRSGVSANLCDALMGFSGQSQQRNFEIKISGAAGPWFDGETKVFSFDIDNVRVLKVASGYYRDDYILNRRLVRGFVRKLHRDKGADFGKVSVEARINESDRSIQIELDAKEYHDAVTAHDKQMWIECLGDVHVKGRMARLLNHSGFRILASGELL
ncbi:hypothetical protein [Delftia acidovorans]|uniref:hypothetical protein n=1 Tax=Delftia acidovorans TaxID=80866 RepID=UPI000BD4A253|nr:hypothetical protein [Delftia acidovorans]SOE37555.1 hypothetical protein SAMN05216519_3604 [Delftia acidovorans]